MREVTGGGQEMSSLCREIGGLLGGMAAICYILNSGYRTSAVSTRIQLPIHIDNSSVIAGMKKVKRRSMNKETREERSLILANLTSSKGDWKVCLSKE